MSLPKGEGEGLRALPPSCDVMGRPARSAQKASWETTSRPLRWPSAHQVFRSIVSLMNFTEPSAMATFTPPGWLLVGGSEAYAPPNVSHAESLVVFWQESWFGPPMWM